MKQLTNPAPFYSTIRKLFDGTIAQGQVDGMAAILKACGDASWSVAWTADALATAFLETNHTMVPVREAYWVSEAWRKAHLRYYPWYGRGLVQCTWEKNYQRADDELGLGGTLVKNLDRMLEPAIAAQTMVRGMQEGWFDGKKLADYLPAPLGTEAQFAESRRIINGTDRAHDLAAYALAFQDALVAGKWA